MVYSFAMSNFDIFTDVYVLISWIIDKAWIFAIVSCISLLFTSFFSFVSGIANNRGYLSILYFFHIGIWIEFIDSLIIKNQTLTSFKKLKFAEALYEALPQGTLQFYFILHSYSSWTLKNWPTLLSACQSALSLGWTFQNQIKDTICNRQLFIIQSEYRCSNYDKTKREEVSKRLQTEKLISAMKNDAKNINNGIGSEEMQIEVSKELIEYEQRLEAYEKNQKKFWKNVRRVLLSSFISIDFLFHILPLIYCIAFNSLELYLRIIFILLMFFVEFYFFGGLYIRDGLFFSLHKKSWHLSIISTFLSMLSIANILFVITSAKTDLNIKIQMYRSRAYLRYCFVFFISFSFRFVCFYFFVSFLSPYTCLVACLFSIKALYNHTICQEK